MTRQRRPVLLTRRHAVPRHRRQMQQHREARRALDQGADRRTAQPENEVSFPMPRHRAILCLGRPLADEDLGGDERFAPTRAACSGHPQSSSREQARGQIALQCTSALDVERLVDRLMADAHRLIAREVEPQALSDGTAGPGRAAPSGAMIAPPSRSCTYVLRAALAASFACFGRRAARSACHCAVVAR
uniref:Integrase catalytic protein n=1 Tax=Pseudomonas sp. K-62 TaxID=76885 RepID=I2FG43_9PSED|nr:integrase catalytic protein [Pseudomonas sp. K-62]